MDENESGDDKQRLTIGYNADDMALINAEAERRSAEAGYKVYVSTVLRDLVRRHLGPEADS